MFEVLNMPLPPMPGGALGMLFGVAALLAGLALLLLGRVVVWRLAAAAAAGGIGVLAAAQLAAATGHDPVWPSLVGGVCLGLIGLGLARGVWAIGLGAMLAAAGQLALLHRMLPADRVGVPEGFDAAELTFQQWILEAGRTLVEWLSWMVNGDAMLTLLTGGAAAGAGLVLGLTRPLAARIFATSVAGAALIAGGTCLTITSLVGEVGLSTGNRPWIIAAVGLLLAIAGMAYQVRSHRRTAKAAKAAEDTKDDTDEKK